MGGVAVGIGGCSPHHVPSRDSLQVSAVRTSKYGERELIQAQTHHSKISLSL